LKTRIRKFSQERLCPLDLPANGHFKTCRFHPIGIFQANQLLSAPSINFYSFTPATTSINTEQPGTGNGPFTSAAEIAGGSGPK
jgi:hypothetical protein